MSLHGASRATIAASNVRFARRARFAGKRSYIAFAIATGSFLFALHMAGYFTPLAEKLIQLRPDIPIIRCTGFSSSINKEQLKIYGICEIVLKPIIVNEMLKVITTVLQSKGK